MRLGTGGVARARYDEVGNGWYDEVVNGWYDEVGNERAV